MNTQRTKKLKLSVLLSLVLVCTLALNGCLSILMIEGMRNESAQEELQWYDSVEPLPDSNYDNDFDTDYKDDDDYNGLVDNRNTAVSYVIQDEEYSHSATESVATLDGFECELEFDVEYVKITGLDPAIEDDINEKIYKLAMHSVYTYYLEPTESIKSFLLGDEGEGPTTDYCWIESTVECYVEYNDESLISIVFDDYYFAGSVYAEYGDLRSFVIDLTTGEVFKKSNEIIEVTQEFADLWYEKALAMEEESFFLEKQPREDFIHILANAEGYTNRYFCCIFIDDTERVRISLTYHMGNEAGIARGWIDVPFTTEELEPYRIESNFWKLYDALGAEPVEADA